MLSMLVVYTRVLAVLFNATSVREASCGTEIAEISIRQNQYLFVFTIMTVIYLPLGFVTVGSTSLSLLPSVTTGSSSRGLYLSHLRGKSSEVVSRCKTNNLQSIFGMHLFDTDDSGVVAARPKFYIALVALSISTYITAGLAYWLVRSRKKDGSGRRNGLPKMTPKKQEQGLDSGPPEIDGQGHAERGISALLKNGIKNRKERGAGRDKGKGKEASTMV